MKSKVSLFLSLLLILNLSLLSSISLASGTESETGTIDVHEIVPQEYFDKYAGVYDTKQEVLDAFGLETSSQGETPETEEIVGVDVDTVDELAAFVAFVYGPPVEESTINETTELNSNEIVEVEDGNQIQPQDQTVTPLASETKNYEVNIYEFGGIYTVKGYVTLIYNMPGGHNTKTTASSALVGATQFASWTPETPLIVATADYKRDITFSGILTTRLAGQEFINKRISKTGTFYSINVIED